MTQQGSPIPTPKRHGISATEARQLSERVLQFSKAENARVNITSGIQGFTRSAANRVTTAGVQDDISVQITSAFGKRVATIETNRLDDTSLERAVRESESLARISPENPQYLPELGPQTYSALDGYYESTGNLSTESRAQAATLGIKAADAAKASVDWASDRASMLRDRNSALVNAVTDTVTSRPLVAIGIAAAVGYLLGRILRSTD